MNNLNDYFDRARRAEPPLKKDDVSSILSERLEMIRASEKAHLRRRGFIASGFGHISTTFSLKDWIMISALLTSAILGVALFRQTAPEKASMLPAQTVPSKAALPQTTMTATVPQQRSSTTMLTAQPLQHQQYASVTQITLPATPPLNAQTTTDTLPAPYDFVQNDENPFVDLAVLKQKVVYPETAKKLGLEGKVNVRVLVMPDGSASPRSFVEYSDVHLFDSSALQSVFATRWIPAKRAGKNVPCWVSVPIHYRLPDHTGKNAVSKAQMLTLTAEELKKIGVEQDTAGIATILGWNKAKTKIYQMKTSIHSRITPKSMSDSIFKEYIDNFRRQGKYSRAAEWEKHQFESGQRSLRDLTTDSAFNFNAMGIATIITPKQVEKAAYFRLVREIARLLSLPRLVTDGHNHRYFVDLSDLPRLQRMRATQKEAEEFHRKARLMNMDSAQARDSINKIFARLQDSTTKRKFRKSDSTEARNLAAQISAEMRAEEQQFEQEKSDVSKLIGIHIPCAKALAEGDEYLLWYDPTPEFIALLPERYRTGLEREVAAAKKYATLCEIPTEEERKAIPGYFDSWRSCDGVLKIASIFPNPADVKATVRFTLAEARSVTITVHNLNGDRLAILEPTPVLTAGEHELPLDFTGRNVGVYLLALTTDKNETAIKRVIISR